jgi:hypothetical protein
MVNGSDFVEYWRTAKEKTSSSLSGRHFGHYKAASFSDTLTRLHVGSINLALWRGHPLARWQSGVTVLLEKERGNCYIGKLRAICLLEGDFNWFLKLTYAERMMSTMQGNDLIPMEQIATKGKVAIDGVLTKQLFYDSANILHEDAVLNSTDAANCYDAVNHTIGSLAVRAMGVPKNAALMYMRCIQLMTFYVRTGYGLSKKGYGGTPQSPFMGLTQGSCASPPVWTAISTMILLAYRRAGHGVLMRTAWSGLALLIAAILYVDDTDLLHMNSDREDTTLFLRRVQAALTLWAKLLQATGGSLKPEKCYSYVLSYVFSRGIARLRTKGELQSLQPLTIPQNTGPPVPIRLKDCREASETLGMFTSPIGDGEAHLRKMLLRATTWSESIRSSTLHVRDRWHSLYTQLFPSVRYGLVPLMTPPTEVESAFMGWYYHLLPLLNVNRHITRDWRWLPSAFQGLGLPNMGIEKLASMLQYFIRHWGSGSSMSFQLRRSVELLQMECGLEGNPFLRDFRLFGCLATNTWTKMFWHYLDYYQVRLEVDDLMVQPVRERDRVFMEEAVKSFPQSEWPRINRLRHYKKIYFMSQLLTSDGVTVRPDNLGRGEGTSSLMLFPRQEPTPSDIRFWDKVVRHMTSPKLRWSPPLGRHLRHPYDTVWWWTQGDEAAIYRADSSTRMSTRFDRSTERRITRGRVTYIRTETEVATPSAGYRECTVRHLTNTEVCILSVARQETRTTVPVTPSSVTATLASLWGGMMGRTLDVGEDGAWLGTAIRNGSLIMVHDGTYQPGQAGDVCAAALVLFCTKTGRLGTATAAEKTSSKTASNFRAEAIGGILAGLILLATDTAGDTPTTPVIIGCDNTGVISHATQPPGPLPEKQPQADVIRALRTILSKTCVPFTYTHVYGHLDNTTPFERLPLLNQLNVLADSLAKSALGQALQTQQFINSKWPYEKVRAYKNKTKLTASFKQDLYFAWGKMVAQDLYISRGITDQDGFNKISFESVGYAMDSFPHGYRVWMCKHVSHFAGTNRMLSGIDDMVKNVCPSCGADNETTLHITTCPDPGRTALFTESVLNLVQWLEETHMDASLVLGILDYLLGRGHTTLQSLLRGNAAYAEYARDHDHLGWQNFLEGRITTSLLRLQERFLEEAGSRQSIRAWSTNLIHHLVGIVHKQWLYRNANIHLKVVEGRTTAEHREIMSEVRHMMAVDPLDLLPCHQHLLKQNWEMMGATSTSTRLVWLEQMDSALAAKRAHLTCSAQNKRSPATREAAGVHPQKQSNLSKRQTIPATMTANPEAHVDESPRQ